MSEKIEWYRKPDPLPAPVVSEDQTPEEATQDPVGLAPSSTVGSRRDRDMRLSTDEVRAERPARRRRAFSKVKLQLAYALTAVATIIAGMAIFNYPEDADYSRLVWTVVCLAMAAVPFTIAWVLRRTSKLKELPRRHERFSRSQY